MNDKNLIVNDTAHDGIDRRGFLKCMGWAGTAVVCSISGGILSSRALGDALANPAALATAELNFVQISDSHIGFNKAANTNVIGTFQEAVRRINALANPPPLRPTRGPGSRLFRPKLRRLPRRRRPRRRRPRPPQPRHQQRPHRRPNQKRRKRPNALLRQKIRRSADRGPSRLSANPEISERRSYQPSPPSAFFLHLAQVINLNSCACVSVAFTGITRTFSPYAPLSVASISPSYR